MAKRVVCPYCALPAELVAGSELPAKFRRVWLCRPCDAWAPVLEGSAWVPAGRLAKAGLRAMHAEAVRLLNPMVDQVAARNGWPRRRARKTACWWLATQVGADRHRADLGLYDEAEMQRALRVLRAIPQMALRRAA